MNNIYDSDEYKNLYKPPVKKNKIIVFFAVLLTVLSGLTIPVSFVVSQIASKPNIFFASVKYSWIMLLFLPVGIISLCYTFFMKKKGYKHLPYFVITLIFTFILALFGCFRFFVNDQDYTDKEIKRIESVINVNLPDNLEVVSIKNTDCILTCAQIKDEQEKISFEKEINESNLWNDKIDEKILNSISMGYWGAGGNYFLVYNITDNSFEQSSLNSGNYDIIVISYETKEGSFAIYSDVKINL